MSKFIPYKTWLQENAEKIKESYSERKAELIAKELGINYYTVSRVAKRLGVSKPRADKKPVMVKVKSRPYKATAESDQYLIDHYHNTAKSELSKVLNVDEKTIYRWAVRLGLKKDKEFMCHSRSKGGSNGYYTDEQKAYRKRRIEEVYPNADEKELTLLAEELGINRWFLAQLASRYHVRRLRDIRKGKFVKYSPEFVKTLAEYYPEHTSEECEKHFGISRLLINAVAWKYGIRKTKEHLHKVHSRKRK